MCTYGNTAHDPIRQIHYKSTSVLVPVPATRFTSVLETRPETSNVNQTCEKGNFVQFAVVMNWHHVVRAPYILLSFFGVKMFSMSAHHIKAHTVYHLSSLRFRIRANKISKLDFDAEPDTKILQNVKNGKIDSCYLVTHIIRLFINQLLIIE